LQQRVFCPLLRLLAQLDEPQAIIDKSFCNLFEFKNCHRRSENKEDIEVDINSDYLLLFGKNKLIPLGLMLFRRLDVAVGLAPTFYYCLQISSCTLPGNRLTASQVESLSFVVSIRLWFRTPEVL